MKEYNLEGFERGLFELGIKLSEEQKTQFLQYYELLVEWNSFMNLTAITEFDQVITKHFLDSLSLVKVCDVAQAGRILDVGTSSNINELLEEYGSTLLSGGSSLAELIRRPELNYKMLAEVDPKRPKLPEDVQEQVNINIKYDGYIKRQMKQVEQFKKMEEKKIPENINYDEIQSLRIEAKQKLNLYRPINIGQASRISGVSPADISVLLVYLGHK